MNCIIRRLKAVIGLLFSLDESWSIKGHVVPYFSITFQLICEIMMLNIAYRIGLSKILNIY